MWSLALSYPSSVGSWFCTFLNLLSILVTIWFFLSKILLISIFCYLASNSFCLVSLSFLLPYCHFSVWKEVKVTTCAQSPIFIGMVLYAGFCACCQLTWSWSCYQKKPFKHWHIPCFIDSNLPLIIKYYWFNIELWWKTNTIYLLKYSWLIILY